MPAVQPQPNSPAQWKEYANSEAMVNIPRSPQTYIYQDLSAALGTLPANAQSQEIYADVLGFSGSNITISRPDYSSTKIFARVLTADQATNITMAVHGTHGFIVSIYASIVDQIITVSSSTNKPQSLELGPRTGNVGAVVTASPDCIFIDYIHEYRFKNNDQISAFLEMELRIAFALFWSNVSVSISICSHVSILTAKTASYQRINAQAAALGQNLAAQKMTGPDMNYAPVLALEEYKIPAKSSLEVVEALEVQYKSIQNRQQSHEEQMAAWTTMLHQAEDKHHLLEYASLSAYDTYTSARGAVSICARQFDADILEIAEKAKAYKQGLRDWKEQRTHAATAKTLLAIAGFAFGIGRLYTGDSSGLKEGLDAILDAITTVSHAGSDEGKTLSAKSMEDLKTCMVSLEHLYDGVEPLVEAVQRLRDDPDARIPLTDDFSGSGQGDANATETMTLASWDKWALESDTQLKFGVDNNVGGASEYQLCLKKHSINGKTLAQAQAETVKAGQAYVYAELNVITNLQDISTLKSLKEKFKGQDDIYADAQAKFYDIYQSMKMTLAIDFQNYVWAYKYWALKDSNVIPSVQKSSFDLSVDMNTLDQEITAVKSGYPSDFQYFERQLYSEYLPANYGALMIENLRGNSHTASFTLKPCSDPDSTDNFATIFTGGSHFRLNNLEIILDGAVPKKDKIKNGKVEVQIQVETSGVYSDIQDRNVFNFTSQNLDVRLAYYLMESGKKGEITVHFPEFKDHAEPTPFTQWTIRIINPTEVDLTGLKRVIFNWKGHARFNRDSHFIT